MQPDIYMTPADVGRVLGLTQHQTKALVWLKQANTVLVAGRIMFYSAEIAKLAEKRGITTPLPVYPSAPPPASPPPNLVYGLPGGSTQETTSA